MLLPHSYHYNGHDKLYAHMYEQNGGGAPVRATGWPSRQELVAGKFMMQSQAGARPVMTLDAGAAQVWLRCEGRIFAWKESLTRRAAGACFLPARRRGAAAKLNPKP